MTDRVLILGTGALATLFGARLARDGARVVMAGTWRAGLEALGRGATVTDATGTWTVPVEVAHRDHVRGGFAWVLVLAKGGQTVELGPVAARCRGSEGLVISLQNGLGHLAALAAQVGVPHTAAGSVSCGATLVAPGSVRLGGEGAVILGAPPLARDERLCAAAALLARAGFATSVTDDLDTALWHKLAINCAINPLTALAGVTNGGLVESPVARDAVATVASEVARVASVYGIQLGDVAGAALEGAVRTGDNRSSMRQDLESGRVTEIDFLNGAVARLARGRGASAPCNAYLASQVRAASAAGSAWRPVELAPLARSVAHAALRGAA